MIAHTAPQPLTTYNLQVQLSVALVVVVQYKEDSYLRLPCHAAADHLSLLGSALPGKTVRSLTTCLDAAYPGTRSRDG